MAEWVPGQRWTSEREPELGLGVVVQVTDRLVGVAFPATGEHRDYGRESAPLRRATFAPGDVVHGPEGRALTVRSVREEGGCRIYVGEGELHEAELSGAQPSPGPEVRLRRGHSDPPEAFELRVAALRLQHQRRRSPVRGFVGGRIALLPHQLGIASEVAARLSPRVLLADEVGLGKTIEAGLILHRLLATGRVRRVLVLVPEALLSQWYVELLRKFNLAFALYDEARLAEGDGTNPFLEAQTILAPLSVVLARLPEALEAGWDLVVVDEAHHLTWSPEGASPAYAAVEALAPPPTGLLLLTATPEQLGLEGHFARLRLLDPQRFPDLEAFRQELEEARQVAALAEPLAQGQPLEPEAQARLSAWIGEDARALAPDRLLEALLDRHGPGRVLFRTSRASVPGFPQRIVHLAPLAGPVEPLRREWAADLGEAPGWRPDFREDPRLPWLADLLRRTGEERVLLICRSRQKAEAVEAALRPLLTVPTALFHEGLTLVQRDRAAAWFTEARGARLLLCSELGSEGRNFQCARHLVLFDLPLDPGLLEQRIGRLDRIGQGSEIHLHVPYVRCSPQEVLARWYHEGLGAFEGCLRGGRELGEAFGAQLRAVASSPALPGLPELLEATRRQRHTVEARLEAGRDRLLELQAQRRNAQDILQGIQDQDEDRTLETFLLGAWEQAFIPVEELAPRTWRLGSAEGLEASFPGMPDDGLGVTRDRARALIREDLAFLTPDHPLATGALDQVLGSATGSTGFARWPDPAHRAVYLEALFVLEAVAPPNLHADRFLAPTPLRVMVDASGADRSRELPRSAYVRHLRTEDPQGLLGLAPFREDVLPRMLRRTRSLAEARVAPRVAEALAQLATQVDPELARLEALGRLHPGQPVQEREALAHQRTALEDALKRARLRLEAVRVIRRG